jgi:hypothetical protein
MDEMMEAFYLAGQNGPDVEGGLAAVIPIVERDLRARIAYRIRAELVCCDVYERDHDTERAGETHAICFWGEAAARIAEDSEEGV